MRVGKNTDSAIWMHRRRFPDCAGIKRNPYKPNGSCSFEVTKKDPPKMGL